MKQLLLSLVFATALPTYAHTGAISSATAETGRASVEPTDSAFLNPAALAFLKGYYFTSGVSASRTDDNHVGENLSLALTDNLPDTVVPTSLGYTQTKSDFASQETSSRDFRLSFGNYLSKRFAFGMGFAYREDQLAVVRHNQMNMGIGTLYAPNADLGFAAVFENILGGSDSVPEEIRLQPTAALGFSYIYRKFVRTRIDLLSGANYSWERPTLSAGLESYMNRWVIVRLGVQRRNQESANAYSAGIGFAGPKFGVHYAYFTSPEQESLARHSVDVAIPIW